MRERSELTFDSGGQRCQAYLYLPDVRPGSPGDVPCVVMESGAGDAVAEPLAERFAEAGLAVLLFASRPIGVQGRRRIDARRQQDDYRAAVAHARDRPGIDPDRIALWGTSFGGGHVVVVAAADPRIAAVVSQAPILDGLALYRPARLARLARKLRMPWLVLVTDRDTTPSKRAAQAAAQAPAGELINYQLTEPTVVDQIDFLTGHLFRA